MIVAIDGPAGSGKSTVAVTLARRLGFRYLDTGAMYRALTWLALREGVSLDDGPALEALARAHPVSFDVNGAVQIADTDVTDAIRQADIDRLVPGVARHQEVRAVMRERQRALGFEGDAVIEGRDIGTVVAPDAEVKVFLVADEAVRAQRRGAERPDIEADRLAEELRRRDERDAVNTQPAEDAVRLDTTELTIEQVVERIERLVAERRDGEADG
jgi:cytidylate kinase